MAKTKISKVAKDLNISIDTAIEFLGKKGIEVDNNPNTRIEDDAYNLLVGAFQTDKAQKNKSEQFLSERQKEKEKSKPAPKPVEEIKLTAEAQAPKILGRIELPGQKPATKTEAPQKPQVKKEEPKQAAPPPKPAV